MRIFAYLVFPTSYLDEDKRPVSSPARQFNLYLHGGVSSPEWDKTIGKDRFICSWWNPVFGTALNVALEVLGAEHDESRIGETLANLHRSFPAASEVQMFYPVQGIPPGAWIEHRVEPPKPEQKVVQFPDRAVA